jgi:hypothetical protein
MKRRHSEPIRKKLTEHRRHTANHSVFFKKNKTTIRVRIIYRDDSIDTIKRKCILQSKRASMLVVSTLSVIFLYYLLNIKITEDKSFIYL